MECNVCLNEWDADQIIPKMLPCGHSFCEDCLYLLFKAQDKSIACPTCLVAHNVESKKQIETTFMKNFGLIALAEQSKSTKGTRLLQMKLSLLDGSESAQLCSSVKKKRRLSFNKGVAAQVPFMNLGAQGGFISHRQPRSRFNSADCTFQSEFGSNKVGEEEECKFPFNQALEEQIDYSESSQANSFDLGQQPPKLTSHNEICLQHAPLKVHSYHFDTLQLMCTRCVFEAKVSDQELIIFPKAVRQIKEKVDQTIAINAQKKLELNFIMEKLTEIQAANRELVQTKLNMHFQKIQTAINQQKEKAYAQLKVAQVKQSEQLARAELKVSEYLEQLQNDEISLQDIPLEEDSLLIFMTKTIEELYQKTVNFTPSSIDLNDCLLSVSIDDNIYNDLNLLLNKSQVITNEVIDDFRKSLKDSHQNFINHEAPILSIQELIRNNLDWVCQKCLTTQRTNKIMCGYCCSFKPLAYLPNLFHSPYNSTEIELLELAQHRKLEKDLILAADLLAKPVKHSQQSDKKWYIISNKWLYMWKCFILNKVCSQSASKDINGDDWADYVDQSQNPDVGILPPGMITNEEDLFIEQSQLGNNQEPGVFQLKQGLRINIHYKAVSESVWQILYNNYGGGPVIVREAMDIYAKEPRGMSEIRINNRNNKKSLADKSIVESLKSIGGSNLSIQESQLVLKEYVESAQNVQKQRMVQVERKGDQISLKDDFHNMSMMEQLLVDEEALPSFENLSCQQEESHFEIKQI